MSPRPRSLDGKITASVSPKGLEKLLLEAQVGGEIGGKADWWKGLAQRDLAFDRASYRVCVVHVEDFLAGVRIAATPVGIKPAPPPPRLVAAGPTLGAGSVDARGATITQSAPGPGGCNALILGGVNPQASCGSPPPTLKDRVRTQLKEVDRRIPGMLDAAPGPQRVRMTPEDLQALQQLLREPGGAALLSVNVLRHIYDDAIDNGSLGPTNALPDQVVADITPGPAWAH